jgi:hypothetical protein
VLSFAYRWRSSTSLLCRQWCSGSEVGHLRHLFAMVAQRLGGVKGQLGSRFGGICWSSLLRDQRPLTRSTIRTPRVSAMIFSVWRVTLLSPRSISPMCARCNPDLSAKRSWDQPFFLRIARIFAPTLFWIACTKSSLGLVWFYPYWL